MAKSLALGLIIALLTSCGFHLRGLADLPSWLNQVAIIIQNANRDLEPLLNDQLQAYNITISTNARHARFFLTIEQDDYQQQITNVSASTAPRQYQLIYRVHFSLSNNKGELILPPRFVVITRYLTINNDRILGSTAEENLLKAEMRRDAAMQIINLLSQSRLNSGSN